MKNWIALLTLAVLSTTAGMAQSLEVMPGTQNTFADVQWLKTFDAANRWSVFSRTRATVDYEGETAIFTGAYLNYTTKIGVGATLNGRLSTTGAGADAGVHLFKAGPHYMVFALATTELSNNLAGSWFSIARYTPQLGKHWKLYISLELFSRFTRDGHAVSAQNFRAGLNYEGYQFGLGLNLLGFGPEYGTTSANPGLFIRKQF